MKKLVLVVALLTMLTCALSPVAWQQVAKAGDAPEVIIIEVTKIETRWVPYPQEFKEFPSVEFLEAWYERNEPPVDISSPASRMDCDDYALWLQEKALSQGWLMSVELVDMNHHMLNLVTIGNDILLIEPQPLKLNAFGKRIWKVGELD